VFSNVFNKKQNFRLIVFINLVFIKKKCVLETNVDQIMLRDATGWMPRF